MRVSDDRYRRDLRRLDLAYRLVRYEARTHTIQQWTGLSTYQIRTLIREYADGHHGPLYARHRGRAPYVVDLFFRHAALAAQGAVFAALCYVRGIIGHGSPCHPSLDRGERLCDTYALYRSYVKAPLLTIEHGILLVTALARAREVRLSHCRECGSVCLLDLLALGPAQCMQCAGARRVHAGATHEYPTHPCDPPHQGKLFG